MHYVPPSRAGRSPQGNSEDLTIERPSVLFDRHRSGIRVIMESHKGSNPRLSGSVARGDAVELSRRSGRPQIGKRHVVVRPVFYP